MKHLSLRLGLLLLGGMPLTAMALGYGAGASPLAADSGASQPAGVDEHANAPSGPAGADGTGATAAAVHAGGGHAHASNATNRKTQTPGKTPALPLEAPWQSLLPGSIQ